MSMWKEFVFVRNRDVLVSVVIWSFVCEMGNIVFINNLVDRINHGLDEGFIQEDVIANLVKDFLLKLHNPPILFFLCLVAGESSSFAS